MKTFNNLKTFEIQKKKKNTYTCMGTFSSNDICFGKKWGVLVKLRMRFDLLPCRIKNALPK